MGSNWVLNPFRQGLLNWGFELAGRLLDFPHENMYITNLVIGDLVYYVREALGSGVWHLRQPLIVHAPGSVFPFGLRVGPP